MIASVLTRYGTVPDTATLDELLDQTKDPLLSSVIAAVRSGTWPTSALMATESAEFRAYHAKRALLSLKTDRLYLQSFHHGAVSVLQLIVPRLARSSVIAECHDAKTSAHFAERKTLCAVRQRFWWPQIREDVKLYCRRCSTCQLCSRRTVPPGHAPMETYHAGVPREVLGIDFIGPIGPTTRKNRYILTMVDHFTRLTVLAPTRQQTAEATVLALVNHWVVYYGVPRIIHSDRGTNFMSQIMTSLCERLGVRRTRTTAYRPQADGRVERTNRTVKECLTRLLHDHPADWDTLLPHVAMAINSTVHDSTGFTPFYLTYGSEMQLPLDLAASITHPSPRPVPEYVDDLLLRFSTAYDLAQSSMLKQATRSKRLYDASARTIFYEVGDKVYYAKKVPNADDHPKFFAPWSGPWTVVERLSDVNLRISQDAQGWTRVVHVDSLCKKAPESPVDSSDDEDTADTASAVHAAPQSVQHRRPDSPVHRTRSESARRANRDLLSDAEATVEANADDASLQPSPPRPPLCSPSPTLSPLVEMSEPADVDTPARSPSVTHTGCAQTEPADATASQHNTTSSRQRRHPSRPAGYRSTSGPSGRFRSDHSSARTSRCPTAPPLDSTAAPAAQVHSASRG